MKKNQNLPTVLPELEEAVIAALILERDAFPKVSFLLTRDTFATPAYASIYEAMQSLAKGGVPIDILTVKQELEKDGMLKAVGGVAFLSELTAKVASSANIEYHARLLKQAELRRQGIKVGESLADDMLRHGTDPLGRIEEAARELSNALAGLYKGRVRDTQRIASSMLEELEERRSGDKIMGDATTGIPELDKVTGGVRKGELAIVAGRPAMGKSAFATTIAKHCAEKGLRVLIFSLEMRAEELVQRFTCSYGTVNGHMIREPENMTAEQYAEMMRIVEEHVINLPIRIDDTAGHTIESLSAIARNIAFDSGVDVIIVDYMQLLTGSAKNGSNREQDVSHMSRGLKTLARDLDVPVIALSQLSRAVENRGGAKRPILSDLRESGSIEQDADMVLFLYRPEYYGIIEDEDLQPTKGVAEVIIAKNRHGKTTTVKTLFQPHFFRFIPISEQSDKLELPPIEDPTININVNVDSGEIPF